MDFLTKELINISGFSVALWHVLAAVAALVLLIIVIVAICRSSRKKKGKQTTRDNKKPVATAQPTEQGNTSLDTADQITDTPDEPSADELVDDVIITIDEDDDQSTDTTDDGVDGDELVQPTTPEQPTEPVEQPTETATQAPVAQAPATPKKPTVKNYHISLRPDGKWQVKLSKGGKAIKLFNTQAEAIAFAKARAKSQDGHITIHKVDGRIRKQKY